MFIFLPKQTNENWVSYQTCHQRGELQTCSHRSKLMRLQRVIGSSLAGCGRAGFGRIWCLLSQESSQGKLRPTAHSQVWSMAHLDYKGFFTRDIFQLKKKHDPAACPFGSKTDRKERSYLYALQHRFIICWHNKHREGVSNKYLICQDEKSMTHCR